MSSPVNKFVDTYRRFPPQRAGQLFKEVAAATPLTHTDMGRLMGDVDFEEGSDEELKNKRGTIYGWQNGQGMMPVRYLLAVLASDERARAVLTTAVGGEVGEMPDDEELREIVGRIALAWKDPRSRRRLRAALDLAVGDDRDHDAATA